MEVSKIASSLQFSPIRRFNPIAAEAAKSGVKVYKLNIGQPDVKTPDVFLDKIKNFDESVIAYQESQGDSALREAISKYFKNEFSVNFKPDEIITTMGGSEAITIMFACILNPDDEVLMPEPYYTNYSTFISTSGGKIKPVTTGPDDGYNYAKEELLEDAISDKTKAICIINPNNPTGYVLSEDEMEFIADFAIKHDLWIIADEVYREFVYDGKKAMTFASIERIKDRLIVIDSVSKRYSACGARVGFIASHNEEFMQSVLKFCQGRLCIPTIDQVGATVLFELPHSYYEEARDEYEARRDAAYEEISQIPDVVCVKPKGAFYLSAELPVDDAEDFLMFMLKEFRDNNETTMFAPCAGFYASEGKGKKEIRLAYVLNPKDMKRACELIKLGISEYNKRK